MKHISYTLLLLLFCTIIGCDDFYSSGPSTFTEEVRPIPVLSYNDPEDMGTLSFTFQMGPYDLPAKTSAEVMIDNPELYKFSLDSDVWMRRVETIIVDHDGNALSGNLIQHILLSNQGEENNLCTTSQSGNPFAAVTSSLNKIELPEKHGYLILQSDPLEAQVVLKNSGLTDFYGIYIKFTISGNKVNGATEIKNVKPILVDLDPCEHKPISIAPGQLAEKTQIAYAPESGSIIKAYGLLQDYGVSISITAKDEKEPFWQGIAKINEDYKVVDLPPFEDTAGIKLKQGESITMVVAYDNSSDNWYDEATGAAMIYLSLDEEVSRDSFDSEEEDQEDELQESENLDAVHIMKTVIEQ